MYLVVFHKQVIEILLTDIVVRYAENTLGATHSLDGHHAIIEQETLEHVRVCQLMSRERALHPAIGKPILRNLQKHALAVAFYLVQTHHAVELGIVGLGVRVDQVGGFLAVQKETLQVVEHHVGIEHMMALHVGVFREAVAVIPGAHGLEGLVFVQGKSTRLVVITDNLTYLLVAEAEHLVELLLQSKCRGDVISAGHVIHGHGADTHHQDAGKAAFELLEQVSIEAFGMGHGMVNGLAVLVQDVVGEIVVLVNDKI